MICVSIGNVTFEQCLAELKGTDFAEIRLDTMTLSVNEVRAIFGRSKRLIATCRPSRVNDEKRKKLLSEAVSAGAAYVDIELRADESFRKDLIALARDRGCRVILSHHDFEKTPLRTDLEAIVNDGFQYGADIVKIACRVRSSADNARLLGLLDGGRPLIVLGLGPLGKITRIAAPLLGSPFTYACPAAGKETADGQIEVKTMRKILRSLKNV